MLDTKTLKQWELKKTSKILNFFGRIAGWLDVILVYLIVSNLSQGLQYGWLLYALPIYLIYINGKYEFKIFMSKGRVRQEQHDYKVIGCEGKQGSGKTSYVGFSLSLGEKQKKNVYILTNVPMRINGKMTYKITPEILNMEVSLPDNCFIFLDEWVLIFSNLDDKITFADLQSTAYLEQLYRHFVEYGNVYGASVSMARAPKMQRDNFSVYKFFDGLNVVRNSYIISPILMLLSKIFKVEYKEGILCWRSFLIRDIEHDNYSFDLAGLENRKGNNSPKWAFAEVTCTYNSAGNFDYDSRFMRNIYKQLPPAVLEQFKDLAYNLDDIKTTGFGAFLRFFDEKMRMARLRKFAKEKQKEEDDKMNVK